MNNLIEYNLGNDPSLLILDDDEPFTRTLGRGPGYLCKSTRVGYDFLDYRRLSDKTTY